MAGGSKAPAGLQHQLAGRFGGGAVAQRAAREVRSSRGDSARRRGARRWARRRPAAAATRAGRRCYGGGGGAGRWLARPPRTHARAPPATTATARQPAYSPRRSPRAHTRRQALMSKKSGGAPRLGTGEPAGEGHRTVVLEVREVDRPASAPAARPARAAAAAHPPRPRDESPREPMHPTFSNGIHGRLPAERRSSPDAVRARLAVEREEQAVRRAEARAALHDSQTGMYYGNDKLKSHMPIVYKGCVAPRLRSRAAFLWAGWRRGRAAAVRSRE